MGILRGGLILLFRGGRVYTVLAWFRRALPPYARNQARTYSLRGEPLGEGDSHLNRHTQYSSLDLCKDSSSHSLRSGCG